MRVRDGDGRARPAASADSARLGSRFLAHQNLFLSACPRHGSFTCSRVFRDRDARTSPRQHRNTTRLAELQRGDAVLVDECLFEPRLRRGEKSRGTVRGPSWIASRPRQRQAFAAVHLRSRRMQPVARRSRSRPQRVRRRLDRCRGCGQDGESAAMSWGSDNAGGLQTKQTTVIPRESRAGRPCRRMTCPTRHLATSASDLEIGEHVLARRVKRSMPQLVAESRRRPVQAVSLRHDDERVRQFEVSDALVAKMGG